MRLNPGITLDRADQVLSSATITWLNARGASGGFYRAYTDAVYATYPQLKQTFAAPDLAAGMRSMTYWNLLSIGNPRQNAGITTDPDVARVWQTTLCAMNSAFSMEIDDQVKALESACAELDELKKLAARPGLPIVCDTNMLIHWRRPSEVAWRKVLKNEGGNLSQARLIVPLRVVDELDHQKYGDGRLADRADRALRYLQEALKDKDPGQPTVIRPDATLEIWVDTEDRGDDADLAILRCAADLATLHPATGVRVLTGDLGMQLRAQHHNLKVLHLPDSYRKRADATMETASTGE